MNRRSRAQSLFGVAAALSLFIAGAVQSETFTLEYFVFSGGGGRSANSSFTLTGSIGVPDAGPRLANDTYTLDGGFWNMTLADKIAPVFRSVTRNGDSIVIEFDAVAGQSYSLVYRDTFDDQDAWTKVQDVAIQTTSGPVQVIDPNAVSSSTRFYRLITPATP